MNVNIKLKDGGIKHYFYDFRFDNNGSIDGANIDIRFDSCARIYFNALNRSAFNRADTYLQDLFSGEYAPILKEIMEKECRELIYNALDYVCNVEE